MNLPKRILISFILLVMYLFIDNLWRFLGNIAGYAEINQWVKYSMRYALQIGLCLVFSLIILHFVSKTTNTFEMLGLNKNVAQGLLKACIFTLPMLLGFLIIAPINQDITFLDILFWSFISGFAEELIFRGYLFGFLFRVLMIGFIPSIILVSFLFAIGHMYQGNDLNSILGVVSITFIGSLIFGWLYIEWDNNLWVPIGTHILMNLYWSIFDIGATNAIGGWGPNVFRMITIMLILGLTIRKIHKEGSNLKGRLVYFPDN